MPAIRPANTADLPALQTLLQENALPYDDLTAPMLAHFLVLQDDDKILGCIGLEPAGSNALLRSLVLQPSMRASGMARRLLAAAETHAHDHGVTALYLLTTTAAGFFEKNGYHCISRDAAPAAIKATSQFMLLCPASATCMAKTPTVI